MKKTLSIILGLFALLAISCTKERIENPAAGQEVEVTFTAELPHNIATKAYADGTTATQLTYAVYNTGETKPVYTLPKGGYVPVNNLTATIKLNLVSGKKYDFVFWVQSPGCNVYDVKFDGQTMTVKYDNISANDEDNDAFYAFMGELLIDGAKSEKVVLKRPFAQINLGTDDLNITEDTTFDPTTLKTSMSAKVYTELNLKTGAVDKEADVTFAAAPINAEEAFPNNDEKYDYLAMNYVLVKEQKIIDCKFGIYEGDNENPTNTVTVASVPVQLNYRTNIYGSLLTDPTDVVVEVAPAIEDGDSMDLSEASTELELVNAVANGGEITLTSNIEVKEAIEVTKNTVIILNGNDITYNGDGSLFTVDDGVTLKVIEEETLTRSVSTERETIVNEDGYIFTVEEGGRLYLNADIEYIGKGTVVYVNGGEAYISAGEFSTAGDSTDGAEYLLKKEDSGLIEVTGGIFHGFNPEENFLAEGYYTKDNGTDEAGRTIYVVVEGEKIIDLASAGRANCYIVSAAGQYKFPATYKGNEADPSINNIDSVELLWESFGTTTAPELNALISDVTYNSEDGYVTFNASDLEGNALIAVKDSEGAILWSWHIWMTDAPVDQVYNNNAGKLMDRNLGATSATPSDGMATYGLFYQWGRKDPFISRSYNSDVDNSGNIQSVGKEWPQSVACSDNGTDEYATLHPMTYITANGHPYEWLKVPNYNDSRWNTSEGKKAVHDPCPPGYRVPSGGPINGSPAGVWTTAFDYNGTFYNEANVTTAITQKKGVDFASSDLTRKLMNSGICWYPAAGYIENDGALSDVGLSLNYWSSTYRNKTYYSFAVADGQVLPGNYYYAVFAQSVRCQKITD